MSSLSRAIFLQPLLLVALATGAAAEEEYGCYYKQTDLYFYADPGDKEVCEKGGGTLLVLDRTKLAFFCNQLDSGYFFGRSYNRKKAAKHCARKAGTLQKPVTESPEK